MHHLYILLLLCLLGGLGLATNGPSEHQWQPSSAQCLSGISKLDLPSYSSPHQADSGNQKEISSLGRNRDDLPARNKQIVTYEDLEAAGFTILKFDFRKGGTSYLHLVEKDGKKYLVKDFTSDSFYNNMAPWEGTMLERLFAKTEPSKTKNFIFGKHVKISDRDVILYDFKEDSESLWDVDTKELTQEKKLLIAKQILDASQTLHEAGIVHRDIKPGNILLDSKGTVFLIDLGLAAPIGEEPRLSIQNGEPARTPGSGTRVYMSPEQASEAPAQISHDIHSLNKVLVELFTGTSLVDKKHYLLMHSAFGIRDLGYNSRGNHDELPVIKTAPEDKGLTPQFATAIYSNLARSSKEKWEMIEKAEKLNPKDFYKYYAKLIERETDAENPSPNIKSPWPFLGLFSKKKNQPWVARLVAEDFLNNRGLIERFHEMPLTEEQRDSIILGYLFLSKNKKTNLIPRVPESRPSPFLHFDQFQSKLRYLQEKGLAKPDSYYDDKLKELLPTP